LLARHTAPVSTAVEGIGSRNMYQIVNTERNNEKASDYETFSLLYLLGVRTDKEEIDLVLIDCFNDVTGADEAVVRLWDVQSKGHRTNTPLKIGEHLVTLYGNFLSSFPFSYFILFLETVDSSYVTDNSKHVLKFSDFTESSKKKIQNGLKREVDRRDKTQFLFGDENKMNQFLAAVDFVRCTENKISNVKNLIEFKNKEFRKDEFFVDIFNEIRGMQSALKNINVEGGLLRQPADVLSLNKFISRNQIVTLLINRLVGIELFNNLSVPIDFIQYVQAMEREDIKDLIQSCNSALCRTFFNKNNKVHVWRLLEFIIKKIIVKPENKIESIFLTIPESLRKKVPTLDETSTKFFIARVMDGLA
jgi:hypothetical protein